jgi:hypothetical protein
VANVIANISGVSKTLIASAIFANPDQPHGFYSATTPDHPAKFKAHLKTT